MLQPIIKSYLITTKGLEWIRPAFVLAVRVYVAWVFFKSGLVKIQSWDSTVMLFEYEYSVPLLSAYWAALLGTIAELTFPVLLVLGLGGRVTTMGLFIFNAIAMSSYPDISPAGTQQHLLWGFMILTLFFYSMDKLSVDYWIRRRFD